MPKLTSGAWLAAWGLTEAEAGSDSGGTRSTAVRDGGSWVLNGSKNFITNASVGAVAVLMAVTDPGKGHAGISAFIDPFGRITERIRGPKEKDIFVEGTLVSDVALSGAQTFYTEYGDVFALSQILFSAVTVVYGLLKAVLGELRLVELNRV